MNKILFFVTILHLYSNVSYSQTTIQTGNFFIYKKDTLMWIEQADALILSQAGTRKAIYTESLALLLDTFKFNLVPMANKTDILQHVFLKEETCAFISSDPFYTYFSILNKVKNAIDGKNEWKQLFTQSFPVATNRSFGSYYTSIKVLKNITLLDTYKAQVEFTNGIIEIHTYNPKTNKFEVETIKNEAKK